jgi:hypothetical protein
VRSFGWKNGKVVAAVSKRAAVRSSISMGDEAIMTVLKRRVLLLCFLVFSWSELPKPFLAQQSDSALLERYCREDENALAERRFDDAAKAHGKLSQLDPKTAEVHAELGLI